MVDPVLEISELYLVLKQREAKHGPKMDLTWLRNQHKWTDTHTDKQTHTSILYIRILDHRSKIIYMVSFTCSLIGKYMTAVCSIKFKH